MTIPEQQNLIDYDTYYNQRFGYSVKYPSNILIPQPFPSNRDGQVFISHDKKIKMSVFGQFNVSENFDQCYQNRLVRKQQLGFVKYTQKKDTYFILFGNENNFVFYEKTLFSQGNCLTLVIYYAPSLQPAFDLILAEISLSFKSVSQPQEEISSQKEPLVFG